MVKSGRKALMDFLNVPPHVHRDSIQGKKDKMLSVLARPKHCASPWLIWYAVYKGKPHVLQPTPVKSRSHGFFNLGGHVNLARNNFKALNL